MDAVNIVAVTDFRNKTKEVLDQVKEGPVILTQRSRPTAVVVNYDIYRAQAKLLEELELKLDDLMLAKAMQSAKELIPLDDLFADYEKSTGNKLDV